MTWGDHQKPCMSPVMMLDKAHDPTLALHVLMHMLAVGRSSMLQAGAVPWRLTQIKSSCLAQRPASQPPGHLPLLASLPLATRLCLLCPQTRLAQLPQLVACRLHLMVPLTRSAPLQMGRPTGWMATQGHLLS